jgi:hypothetical protein
MSSRLRSPTVWRRAVIFLPPLALATLQLWHPGVAFQPDCCTLENPQSEVDWFRTLHVLQAPLFALLAFSAYLLVAGLRGVDVVVAEVGLAAFVVFYTAYDAIAGVDYAVLITGLHDLPAAEAQRALDAYNAAPFVPFGDWGSLCWLAALIAIAVALWRNGVNKAAPLVLIAAAPLLNAFNHSSLLGGPGTCLLVVVAGAIVEWDPLQRRVAIEPVADLNRARKEPAIGGRRSGNAPHKRSE